MPYCSASSVIVNRPLWYSVTRCIRWSIGNNSCHGIRILPRRGGETCYPCRWTEVLPMSLDRAVELQLRTANCKLRTANCELQTANCELQTANCELQTPSPPSPIHRRLVGGDQQHGMVEERR